MLIINLRTVKKAAQLCLDIEDTVNKARCIEGKLDEWCKMVLVSQDHATSASRAIITGKVGALRVASIYCYILIHRTILKTTLGTTFFAHCYKNAVQYTNQMFVQLESLTLLDFESFWFSCEPCFLTCHILFLEY